MKKILIGLRTSIKAIILIAIVSIAIVALIMCVYKPIYSVSYNGETIGYSSNKADLQKRILEYIEKGSGDNVAFVQIDEMPTYKLCFLKRGVETNDDEIFEKVTSTGTTYYKYYAVAVNNEEKVYLSSFDDAEKVVNGLKEKNSNNAADLSIDTKYVTETKEVTDTETAINNLYQKKVTTSSAKKSAGPVSPGKTGTGYKPVSITFTKPIKGAVITSRFGARWGRQHKGMDYGVSVGASIYAAASGTVTYAGWNSGGYGYLVIISHGNGVQTYYAHCSSILTKVGATVKAGDLIAKSGASGHVTGPHLHFEIRINDVAYNPELYLK